jgi:hypothetical protein
MIKDISPVEAHHFSFKLIDQIDRCCMEGRLLGPLRRVVYRRFFVCFMLVHRRVLVISVHVVATKFFKEAKLTSVQEYLCVLLGLGVNPCLALGQTSFGIQAFLVLLRFLVCVIDGRPRKDQRNLIARHVCKSDDLDSQGQGDTPPMRSYSPT